MQPFIKMTIFINYILMSPIRESFVMTFDMTKLKFQSYHFGVIHVFCCVIDRQMDRCAVK